MRLVRYHHFHAKLLRLRRAPSSCSPGLCRTIGRSSGGSSDLRLPDAAPIQHNARHVTGRKRALETRRPFGQEPGAFFVSGCAVVFARKLTYGNFVAIPAIAETKNTRRYWEDFWLMRQSLKSVSSIRRACGSA